MTDFSPFIGSFAIPGTGLNLQDVSYRVLFTTPSFVPADELQGIGRVVRHGQENEVVIYRFLVEPLDVRTMSIQFSKMQVMQETHGGYGASLPLLLLGDAVNDEPMLQALADAAAAAGPSGSGSGMAVEQGEAEQDEDEQQDEDEPPSKRSKGKARVGKRSC